MKSLILLFATVVATVNAVIRPRQSDDTCCFGLKSVGIVDDEVTEDHTGGLSLGGPFQQGGFCFDKVTNTIKDGLKHNCFMRGPAEQFQCYAGAIGATVFDISPPDQDGTLYLTYDNGPGSFYACPVGTGADEYYYIFSASKPNSAGCVSVALALYDSSSGCLPASNDTKVTLLSSARRTISGRRPTLIRERRSAEYTATTSLVPNHNQTPRVGFWFGVSPNATKPASKTGTATTSYTTEPSRV